MSDAKMGMAEESGKAKPAVRLRSPERRQVEMVVQCPDDLVRPTHVVRMVMAVVEKLDLAGFILGRGIHDFIDAAQSVKNRSSSPLVADR